MKSKVSVIIPVFNREKLIVRCLDSILCQTLKPMELIVVDNNSNDSTYQTVETWMKSHNNCGIKFKLLTEKTPGACMARQKGLENSAGEYLIFFDSDDEMLPTMISKAVDKTLSSPETDIVCWKTKLYLLDGTSKITPFMPESPMEGHLVHALLRPQGYMVRKEFLAKAGGWTKALPVWNDFELGLRLLLTHPRLSCVSEVLANVYSQQDSITGSDFSSKEGMWERSLAEMEAENSSHSHVDKNKIQKIINYRKAILAAHYYREGNRNGAKKLIDNLNKNLNCRDRIVMKFSYQFTRLGLRGAWRIVRFFI